jgi:hypothetical protein
MVNRRAELTIIAPHASPEEAAAVIAAVQRFIRDTTPLSVATPPAPNAWKQAALQEGVGRAPQTPLPWA